MNHSKLLQQLVGMMFIVLFLVGCGTPAATPVPEALTITPMPEPPTATPMSEPPTATPTPFPPTLTPIPPTATPTLTPTVPPTPAPTVEYSAETITLTTEDNIELAGTLFLSEGDIAVVLTHMAGENDQQNWIPFAEQIASRGFTALTFDFRCYGQSGCGGDALADILSLDIGAAIDFLREQGFQRIVCMGASMGGRGCVSVAFDKELAGLVIVSGTGSGNPDKQDLADFVSPDMPKLFIVSENDHVADRTLVMTRLYESAPEPKIFETYSGSAHGTELFRSKHGKQFREALLNFLEGIRSPR